MKSEKAIGEGYGKIILFGEHFVVYGEEAVAASLKSLKTVVEVSEGEWPNFDDVVIEAFKSVLRSLGIGDKKLYVKVKQSVPIGVGLGSSAALMVAFAKAVNSLYNLNKSEDELNRAAYEGEKVIHGKPSGIDNTAALLGDVFIYKRDSRGYYVERLNKKGEFHLAIINTGNPILSTRQAVSSFKDVKDSLDEISDHIFLSYRKLIEKVKEAFIEGDSRKIGLLMDVNNALLSAYGVSSKLIEEVRYISKTLGALGSKLTGAGTGGNVISLFKDKDSAFKAVDFFNKLGFKSFYTSF